MILTITLWFAISLGAFLVGLLLYRTGLVTSNRFFSRFQVWFLRKVVYPLLVKRRYFSSITRWQGSLVGSYVVVNGVLMGLGIKTMSDLLVRSGLMASINLIPLFLGGRTNVLANYVGISLHTYYIAHHWLGRIVIFQSLLHVALVIASGKPWTFDSSQISGISAASAQALILLLSLFVVRRIAYEFFVQVHFVLAFVVVFSLLRHLIPFGIGRAIFPIVSLTLWAVNTVLRFIRIARLNSGGGTSRKTSQATIKLFPDNTDEDNVSALRLEVHLRRPMKICPGQYLYLFMSDMGTRRRFQGHPYVIAWWDDSMKAQTLSFLIEPQNGISADLLARKSLRSVTLDGPYGRDLRLEKRETVILAACGIGIAGILPYVRHMTYRRSSKEQENESYRRGLKTRKLDVYWVLEDNDQEEWISAWIIELQRRDSKHLLLTFTCFYPQKQTKPTPVETDAHWRFMYQQKALPIIEGLIVKQIQRSPGKTAVAVCGVPEFSNSIRTSVINAMDTSYDIEFIEVEFRPQPVYAEYPNTRGKDEAGLELAQTFPANMNRRRTQLMRSARLGIQSGKLVRSKQRKTSSSTGLAQMISVEEGSVDATEMQVMKDGKAVEAREIL